MDIKLTRGLKKSKEFGMISRMVFPNKSKVYISKKGWNLVAPDGKEINIPYGEINLFIKETIIQGYGLTPTTDNVKEAKKWIEDFHKKNPKSKKQFMIAESKRYEIIEIPKVSKELLKATKKGIKV